MKELEAIKAKVEDHTPGPWEVYDANEGTMANPMWCVANDAFHNPPADGDEPWIAVEVYVGGKEDAELIAAAPKLLAALEAVDAALVKQVEHFREFFGKDRESMQHIANSNRAFGADCALDAARQAIAEALA